MMKLAELLEVPVGYFPKFDTNDTFQADEDFLLLVARYILDKKPKSVVECGSGLSTIVIGRCLQLINDKSSLTHPSCFSMDHLQEFTDRTRNWIAERKLTDYVSIERFNLRSNINFYEYTFEVPPIDLLVIDGPPGSEHPMSRYGAKTLFDFLSPNATIFLDDLKRMGEIMVRDIWKFEMTKYGFTFEDIDTERGACKITRHKTEKPRVLISVPNMNWIHRDLFRPLWSMGQDPRFSVQYNLPVRKPVEVAYCEMAEIVHNENYDWWLNIDDDNPPSKNPLDLIELDKDIITCPTPIWKPDAEDKPFCWNAMSYDKSDDTHYEWHTPHGLQEVAAVGMGCTLISGRVFENEKMRYQPFMREYKDSGVTHRGTDIAFCKRAKAQGFKVWAHFDYICKHHKEIELTGMLKLMANSRDKESQADQLT